MENIKLIPSEMLNLIPRFGGDRRELNLFLRQCEYVIEKYKGGKDQNTYLMHAIMSRLELDAAALVSGHDDINGWEQFKEILLQYFGDLRTEEYLYLELDHLKIEENESYVEFYNRIQSVRTALMSKVNESTVEPTLKQSKIMIINENALNAFLYNLNIDLVRAVRLTKPRTLEEALAVVMKEVKFLEWYGAKHKQSYQVNRPIFPKNPHPKFNFGIPHQNVQSFSQHYPQSSNIQLFGQPQQKVSRHGQGVFTSGGLMQSSNSQLFGSAPQTSQLQITGNAFQSSQPQIFGSTSQSSQSQTFGSTAQASQPQLFGGTSSSSQPQGFRMPTPFLNIPNQTQRVDVNTASITDGQDHKGAFKDNSN